MGRNRLIRTVAVALVVGIGVLATVALRGPQWLVTGLISGFAVSAGMTVAEAVRGAIAEAWRAVLMLAITFGLALGLVWLLQA